MLYLDFKTNPLVSISCTLATDLLNKVFLTTSLFTTSLSLLKTGRGISLSISNFSTSAFKLAKLDFASLNQLFLHN